MKENNQPTSAPEIGDNLLRQYMEEMESYINRYEGKVTSENARETMEEFKQEWVDGMQVMLGDTAINDEEDKNAVGFYCQSILSVLEGYGDVLQVCPDITFTDVSTFQLYVDEVERFRREYTTYPDAELGYYKWICIYNSLGDAWIMLGERYEKEAIKAFKYYVYYVVACSNSVRISTSAYKFCSCSKFLFQSLATETLGVTSPTLFNDPFDCSILERLRKGGGKERLVRQAYAQCLKVSCFSKNKLLSRQEGNVVRLSEGVPGEYLHPLMWAHYADSHKGICIRYTFPFSTTIHGCERSSKVCYIWGVEYSDSLLEYTTGQPYNDVHSDFFIKGKAWEYENELRLIHFDFNGKEGYDKISVPGCIEAVYFGLKCSKEDEEAIRNILADKKHTRVDLDGNRTEEPIRFYRMEQDTEHFGQLVAVEA